MIVREDDDPDLFKWVQEQNLLRQYDLLSNCVEIGVNRGAEAFDKYMLWGLNYASVANVCEFGGRFRKEPIYVGNHVPPHYTDVNNLMDRFISFVHENWNFSKDPTTIAAYVLWRLNWIHPFIEGNGRTARAACYFVLCMKYGGLLPGKKIVPERIRENREPYYAALKSADRAWADGHFDVSELSRYLQGLLKQQLSD